MTCFEPGCSKLPEHQHGKQCWCEKCLVKHHGVEPAITGSEMYRHPIYGPIHIMPYDPQILDQGGLNETQD